MNGVSFFDISFIGVSFFDVSFFGVSVFDVSLLGVSFLGVSLFSGVSFFLFSLQKCFLSGFFFFLVSPLTRLLCECCIGTTRYRAPVQRGLGQAMWPSFVRFFFFQFALFCFLLAFFLHPG